MVEEMDRLRDAFRAFPFVVAVGGYGGIRRYIVFSRPKPIPDYWPIVAGFLERRDAVTWSAAKSVGDL